MADVYEVETPSGPARVHLDAPDGSRGLLVLGHGAGGGVGAPDLVRAAAVAGESGMATALVEQPYCVAGRKAPPPSTKVDPALLAVIADLRGRVANHKPLVSGGRSFGARVACRTAADSGADAILCLAFPEHPPGKPEKTRQGELDAVECPVLVVQGETDPFGMPTATRPTHEIVTVKGNHGLKSDLDSVAAAVADWLARLLR